MKLLERLRSSSSDRWSPRKQGKGHDKEDQPPATPNTQMPLPSSTSSGATRQQQQQHVPSPLRRLSVPPPPLPSLFAPGQKSDILNRKDLQEVRIDFDCQSIPFSLPPYGSIQVLMCAFSSIKKHSWTRRCQPCTGVIAGICSFRK